MSDEPLVFHYDPAPDPPHPLFDAEPGVVPIYRYLWSGKPGPALVQSMVAIVGDDGEVLLEPTGEFEECEVIDDGSES